MDKKGFTLIELLAIIALLAIIVVIAVPSVGGIYKNIKNNMYAKKIKLIENNAVLYGEDNKDSIIDSEKTYDGNKCETILVSKLVPKYLDKDNDFDCLEVNNGNKGCIIDPRDENNFLDTLEIIVYYKNNKIKAIVNLDNKVCSIGG